MDAKHFKTELENRRTKNAVQVYRLDIQGKRITLSKTGYHRCVENYPKRGIVTEFSRRARARRLRRIAEVNWGALGESSFVTLTYPDEVSDHTMSERKNHRYLINRWICKTVGKTMACFWRVEWMPRLSGNFIGELRPHMHLLYLNCPKICHLRLMAQWMKIIHVKRWTQVHVKPLVVAEAVSVYVAKYCSKEQCNLYLENVPKRNRSGRHAGELRASLIPFHERHITERVNRAIVLHLKRRACDTLWWYDPRFDEGFTMLGQDAVDLIRDINENYLDK